MKIAVSACLLGEKIRHDGGHKHNRFVTDELGKYAEFIPFCPEDIAFGTPRPSIRLVGEHASAPLISLNKAGSDVTVALSTASEDELGRLKFNRPVGIIFKSKSPSCGLKSAKLYHPNGNAFASTDGIFAAKCKEAFPLLPMEEEGRLQDPWLRENFVMQLFAYDAFERFKASGPTMKTLVGFHTVNKFMLQAKDEKLYRELGRIVGNHEAKPFDAVLVDYESGFKQAIAKKSSIKRTRNVLEHLAGFLKKVLVPEEKEILHEQIEEYAAGITPLVTPLSTIRLFAKKHDVSYLLEQTFLEPYPKELALRSHINSGK